MFMLFDLSNNNVNFRTSAKLAIAGGAAYVTLAEGVWSSTSEGSTALQRFRTRVIPSANEYWSKVSAIQYALETKF